MRLTAKFDSQLNPLSEAEKSSIIMKLTEGVKNCVPGFHDRVNTILFSFQQPKNSAQLLFKVRMGLVDKVASSLTNEVHGTNRCFKIASVDGLGVEAILKTDPYSVYLSDITIRKTLEKIFYEDYRAFQLPFSISEFLRGIFLFYGYQGRNENGYDFGTFGKIKDYLEMIFNRNITYEALFIDEKIVDINWNFVNQLLFYSLQQQKIIHSNITPSTLIDCARYSTLFSEQNNLCGLEEDITFVKQSFSSLSKQLYLIQKEFPDYYLKLTENILNSELFKSKLISYLNNLLEEINKSQYFNHINLWVKDIVLIYRSNLPFLKEEIFINFFKSLLIPPTKDANTALTVTVQSQPETCKAILDLMTQHHEELGMDFIRTVLTQQHKKTRRC